jgi:hypothetical protein
MTDIEHAFKLLAFLDMTKIMRSNKFNGLLNITLSSYFYDV